MKLRKTARLNGIIITFLLAPGLFSAGFASVDGHKPVSGSTNKDLKPNSHVSCDPQDVSFSAGSRWQLCVTAEDQFGLIISHAEYQKSPSSNSIPILYDGRLAEIFVPYHPGENRFGDISEFNFPPIPLSEVDCPPPRTFVGSGLICKEIRDYGIAWKDDNLARRGEEVIYWAVLDAANYNYIMEWSFRDDGTILTRAGSTGPKLDGPDDTTGHMHDFTWRLDIDLNGPGGDSARLTKHKENFSAGPSTGTDRTVPIRKEGGRVWRARQFNTLEISDETLVNDNGRHTSYELIPARRGTARHTEGFTKKDFWVTQFDDAEILAKDLPAYIADRQSTMNTDNVIWYRGSVHHQSHMRDEDRQTVPVIWVGFELVPQNLFEGTPFFSEGL